MTKYKDKDVQDEMGLLLDEIVTLHKAKARHDNVFHEGDMDPGMKTCKGCRLNRLTTRLSELTSARDDDHVPSGKSLSRRDEYMEHLLERRSLEE